MWARSRERACSDRDTLTFSPCRRKCCVREGDRGREGGGGRERGRQGAMEREREEGEGGREERKERERLSPEREAYTLQ